MNCKQTQHHSVWMALQVREKNASSFKQAHKYRKKENIVRKRRKKTRIRKKKERKKIKVKEG